MAKPVTPWYCSRTRVPPLTAPFFLHERRSSRSLMVVGDMDQSIYGWRGADPRSLARLLDDYTEASTVMLDLNYRSTVTIANAAQVATMPIGQHTRKHATHWLGAVMRHSSPHSHVRMVRRMAQLLTLGCIVYVSRVGRR